eukprot:gene6893-biopygen13900
MNHTRGLSSVGGHGVPLPLGRIDCPQSTTVYFLDLPHGWLQGVSDHANLQSRSAQHILAGTMNDHEEVFATGIELAKLPIPQFSIYADPSMLIGIERK